MRDREVFVDLLQGLTGSRLTYNYPRIGGVAHDLPPNFARDAIRATHYMEKRLKDLYPGLSLLYLDMDAGGSEVNNLNRLHFLVEGARRRLVRSESPEPEAILRPSVPEHSTSSGTPARRG